MFVFLVDVLNLSCLSVCLSTVFDIFFSRLFCLLAILLSLCNSFYCFHLKYVYPVCLNFYFLSFLLLSFNPTFFLISFCLQFYCLPALFSFCLFCLLLLDCLEVLVLINFGFGGLIDFSQGWIRISQRINPGLTHEQIKHFVIGCFIDFLFV